MSLAEIKSKPPIISRVLEFGFYLLAVLLFLSLGSDGHSLMLTRMIFAGLFFLLFFALTFRIKGFLSIKSPTLVAFSLFLAFELLRAIYGGFGQLLFAQNSGGAILCKRYVVASIPWALYGMMIFSSYLFFNQKNRLFCLFSIFVWCAFLIAMHAIPPLLIEGKLGYLGVDKAYRFFIPIVYFAQWIPEYLVSSFAHPNWTGDVMAFGFFPAVALIVYGFQQWIESRRNGQVALERQAGGYRSSFPFLILYLTLGSVIAAAILLLFSRGTIMSFMLASGVYFLALFIRVRSVRIFILVILGMIIGFLFWAGNLKSAWQGVQSIQQDATMAKIDPGKNRYKSSSAYTNIEGAKRAIRIFKEHPFLGVGTHGYRKVAKQYVTSRDWERYHLADFQAMSHYFQLLAEEGIGALLYFLFLMVYAGESLLGLIKAKSRFVFIFEFSLVACVFMVLTHAAFNHLMQRFSISMLVYMMIGVSLGLLRKDFSHHD